MKLAMNLFLLFTSLICNVNSQAWYQAYLLDDSENGVYSVKYSPDGTKLARGGYDNLVKIYDVDDNYSILQTLEGHTEEDEYSNGGVWTVDFSPDSTKLVSGGHDSTLKVWDVESGVLIRSVQVTGKVESAKFSPDGKRILFATADGYAKLWDIATRDMVWSYYAWSDCDSVDFSPDGNTFATACSSRITIWNAYDFDYIAEFEIDVGSFYDIAFNHDGTKLASAVGHFTEHRVKLYDTTSYYLQKNLYTNESVRSVDFNHDGTLLASSGNDDNVQLWAIDGNNAYLYQTLAGHTSNTVSVDFESKGNLLASASYDKTIRVWAIPTASPTVSSPTVSPAPTPLSNESFIKWVDDKVINEGFLVGSICSFFCTEYDSAQSFIAPEDGEITSVKVGMCQSSTPGYSDPTGDFITVTIAEDNGNDEPGNEIAEADDTLLPNDLPDFPNYKIKTSSISAIVREGGKYWVKFATENYYGGGMAFLVGKDNNPGPGYTDGEVKTQSGPTWDSRNNADIYFKITYTPL